MNVLYVKWNKVTNNHDKVIALIIRSRLVTVKAILQLS